MILIEAIAAVVFITVLCVLVLFVFTGIPRAIRQWRYNRSIHGKIERKEQEIAEHDNYIQRLNREIQEEETEERQQLKTIYRDLAIEKRNQLAIQLQSLKDTRDTEEFERRMERRD